MRWAPALGRLLLGLAVIVALTSVGAPSANSARRAPVLLDSFQVTPGVTATGGFALVQGATYELVVRGSYVEHVDFGGGTTADYDHDAVYCFGSHPVPSPSSAFCSETSPGPYCCENFYVGLGGQEYRFWTLAGPTGTPFSYRTDHTYRTTFTAPGSGILSVTSPFMSTWDTTGQLTVELYGEGAGCVARALAAEICGPQKVDFKFVVDGFPDEPGERNLPEDLVAVELRTEDTTLRRDSESLPWKAKGVVRMTATYLSLHSGLVEKEIVFRFAGTAGYVKAGAQRRVLVNTAKVVKSEDRNCRKDTIVAFDVLVRPGPSSTIQRFVTLGTAPGERCLSTRDLDWKKRKVKKASIGVPVAVN